MPLKYRLKADLDRMLPTASVYTSFAPWMSLGNKDGMLLMSPACAKQCQTRGTCSPMAGNVTHFIRIEYVLRCLNTTPGAVPLLGLGVFGPYEQIEGVLDVRVALFCAMINSCYCEQSMA